MPVHLEEGSIVYYPSKVDPATGRFQATCKHPDHGCKCRFSRADRNSAQGRPLGLLAAWVFVGQLAGTKTEHEALVPFLSLDERRNAREELMKYPGGPAIAAKGRPCRADEAAEPNGQA